MLKELFLPIPPLAEQRRIVERVNELMPLVEEYGELEDAREELDAALPGRLRKSVLQLAVQGGLVPQDPADEPAGVLLERIRGQRRQLVAEGEMKAPKGGESIIFAGSDGRRYEKRVDARGRESEPVCIEDEIPFEIPESWEWRRLGSLVLNRGQKRPEARFAYIDISSIDNVNQKLGQETVINAADAPSRARKLVAKNDVLYATVRPYLHNACIVDKDFNIKPIASTGFAVLSCLDGFLPSFLLYFLVSPSFDSYANANENARGVAYPAINDNRLYRALVPVPPASEQKRIVSRVTEVFALTN
ncbi:MAG: restriction endonuclease subunit S [Collinsella sp.]